MSRPLVTLTMILQNEESVIGRCLEGVRPFIDRWVVVDTGSRDRTEEVVRASLDGIPGEYHSIEWQGFGHARSEALRLAGSEGYAVVIDADEVVSGDPEIFRASLTMDAGGIWFFLPGIGRFRQLRVFNLAKNWKYIGVLHEFPAAEVAGTEADVSGLVIDPKGGNGNDRYVDPKKFDRDAEVLEKALLTETDAALVSRYRFYLAQSYRDGQKLQEALTNYLIRAGQGLGLAEEEVYVSLLEAGRLRVRVGGDPVPHWLAAYDVRPFRAEVLVELAQYYRVRNQYHLAYLFASTAAKLPRPNDFLFVEEFAYGWRAQDELALAAFYTGRPGEAARITSTLLATIPELDRVRLETNLAFMRK